MVMVPVKEAVGYAVQFLRSIYEGQTLHDIRLEEVEISDDEKAWHITLSFLPTAGDTSIEPFALPPTRQYKLITVSTGTGAVRSMKIRTVP